VDPSLPGDTLLRVHPTQIYETLLALAIFGLGVWMIRKGRAEGAVTLTVVALLAIERFGIELLRAKDDRFLGALTVAQAISLAILLASLILAWRRRSRAVASREAPAR
jgi:prolipoprotein diacylglyceryltransferase